MLHGVSLKQSQFLVAHSTFRFLDKLYLTIKYLSNCLNQSKTKHYIIFPATTCGLFAGEPHYQKRPSVTGHLVHGPLFTFSVKVFNGHKIVFVELSRTFKGFSLSQNRVMPFSKNLCRNRAEYAPLPLSKRSL